MLEFRCDIQRFKNLDFACTFQAKNLNFHEKSQRKSKDKVIHFLTRNVTLELFESFYDTKIVRNTILLLSLSLFSNFCHLGPVWRLEEFSLNIQFVTSMKFLLYDLFSKTNHTKEISLKLQTEYLEKIPLTSTLGPDGKSLKIGRGKATR